MQHVHFNMQTGLEITGAMMQICAPKAAHWAWFCHKIVNNNINDIGQVQLSAEKYQNYPWFLNPYFKP